MSPLLNNKTILIVDDAPENLSILGELFSIYKVKVALNGEKALEILEANPDIDLILLDVMMPVMDGFETAKRIKANPVLSKIPIIFITGKNDVDSFIQGFDLGAEDYIRKPFDHEHVIRLVKQTLAVKNEE